MHWSSPGVRGLPQSFDMMKLPFQTEILDVDPLPVRLVLSQALMKGLFFVNLNRSVIGYRVYFGYLRPEHTQPLFRLNSPLRDVNGVEVCFRDSLYQHNTRFICSWSGRLLKLALPLVKTHGFTREALSRSVLSLPANEVHAEPLSDTAVSALFGYGDDARRTLIEAWLRGGIRHMGSIPGAERQATPLLASETPKTGTEKKATVRDALCARLEYNEPALPYLPEVRSYCFSFALTTCVQKHLFIC